MGGAAENRAGAVVHQNEIGDIDRKFPIGIKRVYRLDAGVEAQFFRSLYFGLRRTHAVTLLDERRQFWILCRGCLCQRMIGR